MLLIALRKHWDHPTADRGCWSRHGAKSRAGVIWKIEKLLTPKAQLCAKAGESQRWPPGWGFGAGRGSGCHGSHSGTARVGLRGALSWCTPRAAFSAGPATLLSFLSSFSQQKDYLVFRSLTWMCKTGRSKHLLISTPNDLICSSEGV